MILWIRFPYCFTSLKKYPGKNNIAYNLLVRGDSSINLFTRILLIIILAPAISFVYVSASGTITLLKIINTIFVISLMIFLTGSVMLIIQKGIFNKLLDSFKSFIRSFDKINRMADQIERRNTKTIPYVAESLYTMPILISGIILLILSIFVSIFL
ncbi:DUF3899 domain-containing protein [Cytobacillus oceanisediminis]|uniref:DUF3899 domain-containing protein n=1 Tax=Cytobacillus oceanisediminis TaxID=665099 RepID=UPI0034A0B30E